MYTYGTFLFKGNKVSVITRKNRATCDRKLILYFRECVLCMHQ
jgi:hypothetical protein